MNGNIAAALHQSLRSSITNARAHQNSYSSRASLLLESPVLVSVPRKPLTNQCHLTSTWGKLPFVTVTALPSFGCRGTDQLTNCAFLLGCPFERSCHGVTRKRDFYSAFQDFGYGHRNGKVPSLRVQAIQSQPFTSARPLRITEHEDLQPRRTYRNCVPPSRDTPPKRDTGIASEKEWGINLKNEQINESGINEDGSTWYRESGEDLGDNGYRCLWTVMGGRNSDSSSEWKEAWWEKSDWTGYKELGAEKSGRNGQGDSWWETWQEVLRQDEWSNLARIEKSAQKQAKSGDGKAAWYEKWWEKYNAKGWTEKGAHKYGRLNDQSWWEKWGEQYDGRGAVLKWTDKWAEADAGTKWGDKWEERFFSGMGTRHGETWHYQANGERWSRTWGEEHLGNGKVHKYGKSTSGEIWDAEVEESTYYESEPHYGWGDAIGNSAQLLAIEPRERPPGIYPDIDFGQSPPPPIQPPSSPAQPPPPPPLEPE